MNRTLLALACAALAPSVTNAVAAQSSNGLRFEVAFPASAAARTGRVYLAMSKDRTPEPRLQAGELSRSAPFFGTDVR
ncbi:MAG: hypothetical protein ACREND_03840, partial [Gemmatimonadaceae bacterium]